jgi:hypothetical protein
MKRSKAFILVEILTGMVLQAGFIIVLCTSFYLMLSFYTRTQQTLSARQKGEKVIAYIDARIKNAGLGLGKCSNSGEIREALSKVTSLLDNQKLTLPVSVTSGNWKFKSKNSDKKFTGNRLTLLYTDTNPGKNSSNGKELNLTIRTIESPDKSGYNCSVDIKTTMNELCLIVKDDLAYAYDFNSYETSLKGYTVMAGTGFPLYLKKSDPTGKDKNKKGKFTLTDKVSSSHSSVPVYPGDKLMYLRYERFFVENQSFKFQEFSGASWGNITPSEDGILEMYFELDTSTNILDMYVLASGGINDSKTTQKPAAWPGTWKSEYANYIVYMSCASWKLKNLPDGFNWN